MIPETSIDMIAVLKREEEQATLGTLSGQETEPLPVRRFTVASPTSGISISGFPRLPLRPDRGGVLLFKV